MLVKEPCANERQVYWSFHSPGRFAFAPCRANSNLYHRVRVLHETNVLSRILIFMAMVAISLPAFGTPQSRIPAGFNPSAWGCEERDSKAPAAVAPERRCGATRRRKVWRTPRRFALSGVAGIRASVLDCCGPPPLFPKRNVHARCGRFRGARPSRSLCPASRRTICVNNAPDGTLSAACEPHALP